MLNKNLKIIITIGSILIVAILGSIFVNIGMDWFNGLTKPSMWIPSFVIPIVWTIIYLSFTIILTKWINVKEIPPKTAILLALNGILNIIWCLLFFTLKQTFLGNITIIINCIFGYILIFNIYSQNNLYGKILIIYPIWLSIATSLNTAIWILN